jgi:hypothetical protein
VCVRCSNVISATPRQLESLIRLSEALARMELQEEVAERHVAEALRLMRVSMQQSALDHRTGLIDMDKLYSGVGAFDRELRRHLSDAIAELLNSTLPLPAQCTLHIAHCPAQLPPLCAHHRGLMRGGRKHVHPARPLLTQRSMSAAPSGGVSTLRGARECMLHCAVPTVKCRPPVRVLHACTTCTPCDAGAGREMSVLEITGAINAAAGPGGVRATHALVQKVLASMEGIVYDAGRGRASVGV